MRRESGYRFSIVLVLTVAATAQACTAIPRDTNGALERATGGVLRVGVMEHRPWTVTDGEHIRGVEPQLLQGWAAELNSQVEWRRGHLEELVDALHRGEIDVIAAGLYDTTPYAHKFGVTQPYVEFEDAHGEKHALIFAVTPGESALLLSLDRYLATRDRSAILAAAVTPSADDQP